MENLYQNPRMKFDDGWFHGMLSYTGSQKSYDEKAKREAEKLIHFGRTPNYWIVLHYLEDMTKEEIRKRWKELSRRLKNFGIIARVAMEITKVKGKPADRIHYHMVIVFDGDKKALRCLIEEACRRSRIDQFRLEIKTITREEWIKKAAWYFVKYKVKSNIRFRRRLRLRKFTSIGNWWADQNGTVRTVDEIKEAMKVYVIRKPTINSRSR